MVAFNRGPLSFLASRLLTPHDHGDAAVLGGVRITAPALCAEAAREVTGIGGGGGGMGGPNTQWRLPPDARGSRTVLRPSLDQHISVEVA